MTDTRQTEVVDPIELGTWGKTAATANPDENIYVAVGTVDPEDASIHAIAIFGDAEPIMGVSVEPPNGFDYQLEFTLPQNLAITLLIFSTSGGQTDVEQIHTTTGPS